MAAGVLLCLMANGYGLIGVVLEGSLFWATPVETVEVAQWVNGGSPARAVVAVAPREFASSFGYFMRRRLAIGDERHALLFGADPQAFDGVGAALQRARGGGEAFAALDALALAGANVMLLDRRNDLPAWVASACFETVYENRHWVAVAPTAAPECSRP